MLFSHDLFCNTFLNITQWLLQVTLSLFWAKVVENLTLDSKPNGPNTAATALGRDKRTDEIFKAFWPAKVP
jgi:hypothetical protein